MSGTKQDLVVDNKNNPVVESSDVSALESSEFTKLGVQPYIVSRLIELGITEPTLVQEESLPIVLKGGDVSIKSATGSGKTMTFVLPMLAQVKASVLDRATTGLVVTPTRELAEQVSRVVTSLDKDVKPVCVIGGTDIKKQINSLKEDRRIVVGTPGRVNDLLKRRELSLSSCSFFALDEADEMFSMGFYDEVVRILESLPTHKQGVLVSATMNPRIEMLGKRFLNNPVNIDIETPDVELSLEGITHKTYTAGSGLLDKVKALLTILDEVDYRSAIVFL